MLRAFADVRRHCGPVANQIRRPFGGGRAVAAGLRGAAEAGRAKMAQEKPGQTLQATALVHEAYIRLVDVEKGQHWNSRGHFFAAAAEAMRRILVEKARRKGGPEAGGRLKCVELSDVEPEIQGPALICSL